jgi:hypothetical protein
LNNEKICCEISEDKIAVCEKTAGLKAMLHGAIFLATCNAILILRDVN